jgi:hypothetical protein
VIELKNPADEKATICGALNQLQTCDAQVGRREEPKTDSRGSLRHVIRPPHSVRGAMRIHRVVVRPSEDRMPA